MAPTTGWGTQKISIENMASVTLAMPEAPIPNNSRNIFAIDAEILQDRIISYANRKYIIDDRMYKAYSLIVGQCSEGFRGNIKGTPDHPLISLSGKPIYLLKKDTETFNFQFTK